MEKRGWICAERLAGQTQSYAEPGTALLTTTTARRETWNARRLQAGSRSGFSADGCTTTQPGIWPQLRDGAEHNRRLGSSMRRYYSNFSAYVSECGAFRLCRAGRPIEIPGTN